MADFGKIRPTLDPMNRRELLQALSSGGAMSSCLPATFATAAPQPVPFRTIYSNDTTHILSCKMPWRNTRDPFTDADLAHSITEAAGVDAHFLQPGLGWIPWWKSKLYSPEEHYTEFLQKEHGHRSVNKLGRYLLEGGDLLETLVRTCREIGVAPFLSFRLNDGHHVRELKGALEKGQPSAGMSRFYWENYKRYRIGSDPVNWDEGVFDWAIPEVRDHMFSLIKEACGNYDLAGLELDFLRHWVRFGPGTPQERRREITSEFVVRIRTMLDETAVARGLPRRWLCIRVPAKAAIRPLQGIDLLSLTAAGVDMVNLSYSYFTYQDDSVRQARKEAGDSVAIYAEMTHCTMTGTATAGSGTQPFLRTTDAQFYTTAQLAYEQGANGVSLFNFPYYRYHVTDTIGPFHEPPFQVLPKLKDRSFLGEQTSSYFITQARRDEVLGERLLPAILDRTLPGKFSFEISREYPPTQDGILRLRSDEDISDREIEVRCGGQVLTRIPFVEQPIPHPYAGCWLGTDAEHACFAFPASLAGSGSSEVEIMVKKGIRVKLIYLDLIKFNEICKNDP